MTTTTKQGEKDIMLSVAHIIMHYCGDRETCKDCAFFDMQNSDVSCIIGYQEPYRWKLGGVQ